MQEVTPFECPRARSWDKESRRSEMAPSEVAKQGYRVFTPDYIEYLHSHVKYEPKGEEDPYTIVVHMRRKKLKPCKKLRKGFLQYLPNSHYQTLIDKYMKPGAKVIIYSQPKSFESLDDFTNKGYDVQLTADETVIWKDIANADVVILSRSQFSSTPAVVARGIVVYTPFWREPLKHWEQVDAQTMQETEAEIERLKEFC